MGKIIELNEKVANMISAGEVVERPINVVKELVENSIDANSNFIVINLFDSGLKKIEIIDNGDGMDQEDAILAFRRHATSKLKNEHDLFRISTLGFRGEAIPSIASISEFILKTKKQDSEGIEIVFKGSKFISNQKIAMNKGTHIIVNNLFYNTPARLKYLKGLNIELSYIVEIVEKLALSHPNISFKLTNNSQIIMQTSNSEDEGKNICDVYGINTFKKMLFFEDDFDNIHIKGFISNSELYKSKRNDITLIVNNRIVKNNNLIYEIMDSYTGFIPVSKYPVCIIYIGIDPFLIDVNVSPSKTEIKFSNDTTLIAKLRENIIKTLKVSLYHKITNENKTVDYYNDITDKIEMNHQNILKEDNLKYEKIELFDSNYVEVHKVEELDLTKNKIPYLEYIGQLMGTYLLFQNEEGLYLFDQHACEEKINYETIIKKIENAQYNEKTDLLISYILDLKKNEFLIVKDNLDKLLEIGFLLEETFDNSYIIRSIPHWLKGFDLKETIEEIIFLFVKNKKIEIKDIKDDIAKMAACKKSIKANHFINKTEVEYLLKRLNEIDNPFTCPHGRPSIIKISTYEIEKLFKRIV